MNLFSEDIELLTELYSKNSIELYYFHEKYKLSPQVDDYYQQNTINVNVTKNIFSDFKVIFSKG